MTLNIYLKKYSSHLKHLICVIQYQIKYSHIRTLETSQNIHGFNRNCIYLKVNFVFVYVLSLWQVWAYCAGSEDLGTVRKGGGLMESGGGALNSESCYWKLQIWEWKRSWTSIYCHILIADLSKGRALSFILLPRYVCASPDGYAPHFTHFTWTLFLRLVNHLVSVLMWLNLHYSMCNFYYSGLHCIWKC